MADQLSTGDVDPHERLSFWREVASTTFLPHEFASPVGQRFLAKMRFGALGQLGVSVFECDPCNAARTARHVARDDTDDLLLFLHIDGDMHFDHGDRTLPQRPGSMIILDGRHPSSSEYRSQSRSITVKIPRPDLEVRVGDVTPLTARTIASSGALTGLAAGFLSMLPGRLETLDAGVGERLAEQTLDLVALAFTSELEHDGVAFASPRAVALMRLKTAIESRLSNFQLRPAEVAAAAGISVRYANLLLAEEGFSVERYIQHRRLERCRRALEDPLQVHRSIGEIAFGWGFSVLAHFTRRFRAAYGCSPGDFRRRALERSGLV